MNGVEFLVGTENISNLTLKPYSEVVCSFANTLSAELMHSKNAKGYPDVMSFAFWCRKANIAKLKQEFSNHNRLGRGLAFHITPSNVPVNFAFSFMFSLLAGNSNIVRLPSRPFSQVQIICEAIGKVIEEYPLLKKRNAFVSYSSDSEATLSFCAMADARIIWGGDETIRQIRMMPTKPRCVDITFADRYSIAVLNGNAVKNADNAQINKLAEQFYNDTYLMDQNACSSPQTILWIQDSEEARERFWEAVRSFASRHYSIQAAVAVDKYVQMCRNAIEMENIPKACYESNMLYRIELSTLPADLTNLRGKGGYFYEYRLLDLNDLITIVNRRYQTVTYFGINPRDLQRIVIENGLSGIDRIVPVGEAMDIGVIWDGYDIVGMLSRIINKK